MREPFTHPDLVCACFMNEKKWMIPDPVRKGERSATRPDADPSRHVAPAERPPALPAFLGLCSVGQRCGKANGGAEVFFQLSIAPVLQKT